MKLESAFHKFLTNKIVLYIVSVISILNVLGYLVYGNTEAALYFIIISALVYCFSKNMIIVFLVPLILVNLSVVGQKNIEGMDNATQATQATQSIQGNKMIQEGEDQVTSTPLLEQGTGEPSGSESFKGAKKSNHKLDYSGTLSETYSNLNTLLGSEGMKALTDDTKKLLEQQKQLADSMKGLEPILNSFGPLMKQAEGLLGGINGTGGIKGMEGLSDMMKKLSDKTSVTSPSTQ